MQLSEIATAEAPLTALTILEALQTVVTLLDDQFGKGSADKLIAEMEFHAEMGIEGSAEQAAIVKAVLASDHVQAGW